MFTALLTLTVLSSAPLEVRVLEREHPTSLHLEAINVQCDGEKVASTIDVTFADKSLKVGKRTCTEITATEATMVRVGTLERAYPDRLIIQPGNSEMRLINRVDVENYLPSVVAAELNDAPPEALKAQAIVSRTFALGSRKRHGTAGYDVCDLAHCQVYRGHREETKPTRAAVEATAHQVLLVGGVALKPTYFHAACGGSTSTALDVFGEDFRTVGVSDSFEGKPACSAAADFDWQWQVPSVDLVKAIGGTSGADAFVPLKRDAGGRVVEVTSFGKRMSGNEFAARVGRVFGWQTLRSMRVTASEVEGTMTFKGTGIGHGVGFCQAGAKKLAESKLTAAAILKRYFPESQVRPFDN